jgi:hypothetical protein
MKNKVYMVMILMVVLGSSVFAADAFTQKFIDFINTTVLTWTRIIGSVAIIVGISGMAMKKGNEDATAAFMKVLIGGALIAAIPEIINLVFGSFGSSSIDALN